MWTSNNIQDYFFFRFKKIFPQIFFHSNEILFFFFLKILLFPAWNIADLLNKGIIIFMTNNTSIFNKINHRKCHWFGSISHFLKGLHFATIVNSSKIIRQRRRQLFWSPISSTSTKHCSPNLLPTNPFWQHSLKGFLIYRRSFFVSKEFFAMIDLTSIYIKLLIFDWFWLHLRVGSFLVFYDKIDYFMA